MYAGCRDAVGAVQGSVLSPDHRVIGTLRGVGERVGGLNTHNKGLIEEV